MSNRFRVVEPLTGSSECKMIRALGGFCVDMSTSQGQGCRCVPPKTSSETKPPPQMVHTTLDLNIGDSPGFGGLMIQAKSTPVQGTSSFLNK